MNAKFFVDSNIWLYAFMDDTSSKRARALNVIEKPSIILSTQIINEVCSNLLRKADYTEQQIMQTIDNFQRLYPILNVTTDNIRQAASLRFNFSVSYWDSIIIATATAANCTIIYSEDMQHGQRIGNLTIENPFV